MRALECMVPISLPASPLTVDSNHFVDEYFPPQISVLIDSTVQICTFNGQKPLLLCHSVLVKNRILRLETIFHYTISVYHIKVGMTRLTC